MKRLLICTSVLLALSAQAKLPAPVLTDEAKAKAAEAAAKTAHGNKVAAFQLCRAMDRAAAHYFKTQAGKATSPALPTPPCADPGPFVPTVTAPTGAAPAAPAAPAAAPAKKS
ncbi:MAG: hypothetical protein RLZZ352_2610 [Pseudomonadota bacterium]|jgi:hypothetical protein